MATNKEIAAVGLKRLQRLALLLDGVPPERFDMSHWSRGKCSPWTGESEAFAPPTCGTTACAGGWATTVPEFQLAGLKMDGGMPIYDGQDGYQACIAFFRVPGRNRALERLFDPLADEKKNTPRAVARRIRQFIASNKSRTA